MTASQKLGQKLLQGWTMLGDSCTDCSAPLMRSRDGTQTICVVCEPRPVIPESLPIKNNQAITVTSSLPSSEEFYQNVGTNIIKNLNIELKHEMDTQTFIIIIESALNALQLCSPIPPSEDFNSLKGNVCSKITNLVDCSGDKVHHLALNSRFESITHLLKLLKQLEAL